MRRYWLSILVAVLAVSGIGTYYSIVRQDYLPEYRLETIQGDPQEAAGIQLSGSHYLNRRSESLEVTTNGSEYIYLTSNIRTNRLLKNSYEYSLPGIKDLLINYKSFMRGKPNWEAFYRDQDWIIYADHSLKNAGEKASSSLMKLSLLNVQTNKETKFELKNKISETISERSLIDVQRVDNEIHLLFYNYYYESEIVKNEIIVIDLTNGKLLRNKTVDFTDKYKEQKDVRVYVRPILARNDVAPSEMVLFNVKEQYLSEQDAEENKVPETISETSFLYSYRTGLMTELSDLLIYDVLGDLQNDYYMAKYDTNQISLSRYQFSTHQYEKAYVSLTAKQLDVDEIKFGVIRADRLYVQTLKDNVTGVIVLELTTGKLLYSGHVVEVGHEKKTAEESKKNPRLLNMSIIENRNG